jgi:hypothetical protein
MAEESANPTRDRIIGAAAIAVIVVAVTAYFIFSRHPQVNAPKGRYFANENTGELLVEPLNAVAPLADANGQLCIVRATVYTSDGGTTKTAAFYDKYNEAAKKIMDSGGPTTSDETRTVDNGLLVRLPAAGSPWVRSTSTAGRTIMASIHTGDGVRDCSIVLP